MVKPLAGLFSRVNLGHFNDALVTVKDTSASLLPASPKKRVILQSTILSMGFLVVSSLTPGVEAGINTAYNHDYIDAYAVPGDVLVADNDGYLIKINPQTTDSNRIGMNDFAVHTVESGEVLSSIAEKYGVKVQTIMWENNLANANALRTGQKLLIPPVNGISYDVQSGDTIEKVAKKYEISTEAIIAQNGLGEKGLTRGQSIFLPGAEPIYVAPVIATSQVSSAGSTVRSTGSSEIRAVNANPSTSTPTVGKVFIFPTRGSVTQGYKSGHYALDIADRSKPPIWAAGGGTVVKSSVGTWGGGYGNHIIIDHGNGLKTLYAHMDTVSVNVGDNVSQGDVLGIMGNTGRVYGATGIHLHWEVWQDGVKQYPGNYY